MGCRKRKLKNFERSEGGGLNWAPVDKYFIKSGLYGICKTFHADGARYSASFNKKILKTFKSVNSAKQFCEKHKLKSEKENAA